jgi:hypothetical protein
MLWRTLRPCVQTLALLVVTKLIVACSAPQIKDEIIEVADERTLAVPNFSISVKLSDAAHKKLQAAHESVLVIAYFDGDPVTGKEKDNSPMRDVVLGGEQKLTDANNVATFSDTKISQSRWNDLSSKDYYVTINVNHQRTTCSTAVMSQSTAESAH